MAVRSQNAKFIKPYAMMLFQQLPHDLTLNFGASFFQDFLEWRRITALYGRAGTLLTDRTLEIAFEMALCSFGRYWQGTSPSYQKCGESIHLEQRRKFQLTKA